MPILSGFAFHTIRFTKSGDIFEPQEETQLLEAIESEDATDLLVLAHGWNNSISEAEDLYEKLLGSIRGVIDARVPDMGNRRFVVMGVLWPSKKFAEIEDDSGMAAGIGDNESAELEDALTNLQDAFDGAQTQALEGLKDSLETIEDDPVAQRQLIDTVRSVLTRAEVSNEDASETFFDLTSGEILQRLAPPAFVAPSRPADGGGAADIGDEGASSTEGRGEATSLFSSAKKKLRDFLNLSTYYEMKGRAGLVGRTGVNAVIRAALAKRPGLKVHLIGHSFGGRLVTSAADAAAAAPAIQIRSMTLLQAAFSHNGFAENFDGERDGFFRGVISNHCVTGPILVTHTVNDVNVGRMYPLASRISRDDSAFFGSVLDSVPKRYGGIGRNGAVLTPEAVNEHLLESGGAYSFLPGKIHNLQADDFIHDHSDVKGTQVAYAILSAVAAT